MLLNKTRESINILQIPVNTRGLQNDLTSNISRSSSESSSTDFSHSDSETQNTVSNPNGNVNQLTRENDDIPRENDQSREEQKETITDSFSSKFPSVKGYQISNFTNDRFNQCFSLENFIENFHQSFKSANEFEDLKTMAKQNDLNNEVLNNTPAIREIVKELPKFKIEKSDCLKSNTTKELEPP